MSEIVFTEFFDEQGNLVVRGTCGDRCLQMRVFGWFDKRDAKRRIKEFFEYREVEKTYRKFT